MGIMSGMLGYATAPIAMMTSSTGMYRRLHASETACGTSSSATSTAASCRGTNQPRSRLSAITFLRKWSMKQNGTSVTAKVQPTNAPMREP